MLRSVVGVDADVFVRKVGGPERAGAITLVQINADRKLRLLNVGMRGLLVIFRRAPTVTADGKLAKRNVYTLGVDLRAGVADGSHQPPPVGIAARPSSLHQR